VKRVYAFTDKATAIIRNMARNGWKVTYRAHGDQRFWKFTKPGMMGVHIDIAAAAELACEQERLGSNLPR
jgi:hypothetical protein